MFGWDKQFRYFAQRRSTKPHADILSTQADQPRPKSAVGKSERAECSFHCIEAGQGYDLSSRQKENRGGAASEVGEGEGGEEGCLDRADSSLRRFVSGNALLRPLRYRS